MRVYEMVSADGHIVEPPDLWKQWLPAKHQARAPRLVKDEEGGDAWLYGDDPNVEPIGLVTVSNKAYDQAKWTGVRYEEIRKGCFDALARLEDQDLDGLDAEVIYPPVKALLSFMNDQDPEFHAAGFQGYNDWQLDGFQAVAPDRLVSIVQMPNLGVEAMVAELERCARKGARGVGLLSWPSGKATVSSADDPFWAAAQEMGIPVSIHIRLAGPAPPQLTRSRVLGPENLFNHTSGRIGAMPGILSQFVYSGVFDRFPGLTVISVETGVGWIPFVAQDMDDTYWRNRGWTGLAIKHHPSYYLRRNLMATFVRDAYGLQNRHAVGVDNIMWGSDYPHHINDWPFSRRVMEDQTTGIPEEERRKLFCDNAVRTYKLNGS